MGKTGLNTKGQTAVPIKIVIRKHMQRKFGDESNWPAKVNIAAELKTQPATVKAWLEERVTRPELDTLDKWCDYLNVGIEDILSRSQKS